MEVTGHSRQTLLRTGAQNKMLNMKKVPNQTFQENYFGASTEPDRYFDYFLKKKASTQERMGARRLQHISRFDQED